MIPFLFLKRIKIIKESTIGELYYVDGTPLFMCHTLEDLVRPVKIPKKTAIPEGEYAIIIDYSVRFKRNLPHILKPDLKELDNFSGVRIHTGNTTEDTEGCILVGEWDGKSDFISKSKLTFDKIYPVILENYRKYGKVKFIIKNMWG